MLVCKSNKPYMLTFVNLLIIYLNIHFNVTEMLFPFVKLYCVPPRGRESPKSKIGVNASTGDTSVQLKINGDSNRGDALKEDNTQPNDSGPNIGDPNSLNVHVHAEPPLKMRTIIGYPKPSSNVDVDAIKKLLRYILIFYYML